MTTMLSTEKNGSIWNFFFVGKESTIYAADYGGTVKLKENVQQEARCDFRIIKTLQEPLKKFTNHAFFLCFFVFIPLRHRTPT